MPRPPAVAVSPGWSGRCVPRRVWAGRCVPRSRCGVRSRPWVTGWVGRILHAGRCGVWRRSSVTVWVRRVPGRCARRGSPVGGCTIVCAKRTRLLLPMLPARFGSPCSTLSLKRQEGCGPAVEPPGVRQPSVPTWSRPPAVPVSRGWSGRCVPRSRCGVRSRPWVTGWVGRILHAGRCGVWRRSSVTVWVRRVPGRCGRRGSPVGGCTIACAKRTRLPLPMLPARPEPSGPRLAWVRSTPAGPGADASSGRRRRWPLMLLNLNARCRRTERSVWC